MNPGQTQILLPLLIAVLFIALNARRMMRPRRFRPVSLWIGPILVLAGAAAFMATQPTPTPVHFAGLAVALAFGGALGWARAKLVKIEFEPETDMVMQRGTPFGLLLLIGLIVLRSGRQVRRGSASGARNRSRQGNRHSTVFCHGHPVRLCWRAVSCRQPPSPRRLTAAISSNSRASACTKRGNPATGGGSIRFCGAASGRQCLSPHESAP